MSHPNRNLRFAILLAAVWFILLLLVFADFTDAIHVRKTTAQIGVFIVLAVAPGLPVIWAWATGCAPFRWPLLGLLSAISLFGVFIVMESSVRGGVETVLVPILWGMTAVICAGLLNDIGPNSLPGRTRVAPIGLSWNSANVGGTPSAAGINSRRNAASTHHLPISEHLKQASAKGFPNIIEGIEFAVQEIDGMQQSHGLVAPFPGNPEVTKNMAYINDFMVRQVAHEAVYCGCLILAGRQPDFDFINSETHTALINHICAQESGSQRWWNGNIMDSVEITTREELEDAARYIDETAKVRPEMKLIHVMLKILPKCGIIPTSKNEDLLDLMTLAGGILNRIRM